MLVKCWLVRKYKIVFLSRRCREEANIIGCSQFSKKKTDELFASSDPHPYEAKLRSKTSLPDWEAKLGNHIGEQSREAMLESNMANNTGKHRFETARWSIDVKQYWEAVMGSESGIEIGKQEWEAILVNDTGQQYRTPWGSQGTRWHPTGGYIYIYIYIS